MAQAIPAVPAVPAMPAMPAMPAVGEHVQQGASEKKQERQHSEEMSPVLSEQEKSGYRGEASECQPCPPSGGVFMHGLVLHSDRKK